jgi:hypothetical protein
MLKNSNNRVYEFFSKLPVTKFYGTATGFKPSKYESVYFSYFVDNVIYENSML